MALILTRRGFVRVRPLAGGVVAWSDQKFPLEAVKADTSVL